MEKEKKPSKKQPAPAPAYDPAEVEARMRLAVAVEGLEHAMVSRDIEVIGSAIARFGPDAPDTNALWRATMLKKELFASIKEAKRQAEKAVPPPAEKVTTAVAVQRLEEAMKANDLATLKAAITQYEEAADETDALEDARGFVATAMDALDVLPEGPARDALGVLGRFVVERVV